MDKLFKKQGDIELPLKIAATICFGRYSGLVSYCLSEEKHPQAVGADDGNKAYLPTTAVVGSACAASTFFLVNNRYWSENLSWLIVGSIPITMSLTRPAMKYFLRNTTPAQWYRFKTINSVLALAVFSFCTYRLAVECH